MIEKPSKIIEDFRWLSPPGEDRIGVWVLLGVSILVIAAVVFLLRKKSRGLPFFPPPSPHEKALRALRELSGLLAPGRDAEFVKRLSRILRIYIQDRFGLRAPFRSTEEFLHEARASGALPDHHRELLSGFLASCDRVKFARRRASLDEMRNLFHSAEGFVKATIPAEAR